MDPQQSTYPWQWCQINGCLGRGAGIMAGDRQRRRDRMGSEHGPQATHFAQDQTTDPDWDSTKSRSGVHHPRILPSSEV